MTCVLEAISGGETALSRIAESGDWRVSAVFRRSFHVTDADNRLVCIGSRGIGNGPLNIICSSWDDGLELSGALAPGSVCRNEPPVMRIGDRVALRYAAVNHWSPASLPGVMAPSAVARGLRRMLQLARNDRKSAAGLWPVVSAVIARGSAAGSAAGRDDALAAMAGPGVLSLFRWLCGREASPAGARGLIGLGPGLTPSGDDLCSGLFVALWATGREVAVRQLQRAVFPLAQEATSRISFQFLQCAAAGQSNEILHRLLAELMSGGDGLETILDQLGNYGHSSGWDLAAGILLALSSRADVAL